MSPTTDTDAATVQRWLAEGADVRLLDVRTPAEFETAHIPGAYNVPLQELGEYVDHLAAVSADTRVVTVCQSGNRARQARAQLAGRGMQVHCMDGGMKAWEQAHGEVRRGRQRWDLERQVRLVAGGLVVTGIAGSVVFP
ncbi:MAG TPA: rhodanese-like domain-containing protein, partial [Euzebyales bacterium]|nr:rhodanese-like domain-containing protein [Euzebyales bacterium]